ncbi:ATP-dependent 6-phosphofructokinase [Tomitella fengzijianii]|uniref:ATP-dependent 6-phosphofructokinase n=1 Tax=Tomitella fengzijianii TaxID=2597660 RepID=A0A516X870_9ACTN|nr:ATP-dependent 6-phosphofructokinase [Tomitella fengzijianii]QDQ99266.1 6-phosphofructokinase [Tomitella fengzijianii]
MRIGILTGGGDCPGLNAAIRGITRAALDQYGSTVVGFHDGWRGLLTDSHREMSGGQRLDRILPRGGTILGTARVNPERLRAGLGDIRATLERNRIDALIPIGGEGTLKAARWLSDEGVPVVGVPKTIDNDIGGTDYTFGFDTAVSIATDAMDRLHTTAESHRRVMLVEVMGRHTGWIALRSGIATGAHIITIPEDPFDIDEICGLIRARFGRGDRHVIGVIAEGSVPRAGSGMALRDGGVDEYGHEIFTGVAAQMAPLIERDAGVEVRTTVLGYIQRGGTPSSYDRVLASRLGAHAARAVHDGAFGTMAAVRGTRMTLTPLADAVCELKTVPLELYREARIFFG